MRHAVADVQDDAGGPAGGVEAEHGRGGHEEGGGAEGLEEGLGELLAVGGGIVRRFREQDGVLVHLGVEVGFGVNVLDERWMRGVTFIEGLKQDWVDCLKEGRVGCSAEDMAVVTSHHVSAAVAPTKCR